MPEPEKINVLRPSAVRREGLGQSEIKREQPSSSEHLYEDAGDEDRGDGHGDETADDHRGEELSHQEIVFLAVLRDGLAGVIRDDLIKRETVKRGKAVREAEEEAAV